MLTLLIPLLGRTVTAMIIIRVLQGLFEGLTFPCIHDLWVYWAPIPERSRMASIAYAGMLVGTVISMPISAVLATSLGWESIFYVFGLAFSIVFQHKTSTLHLFIKGGLGVLWWIVWVFVVKSSPEKDRFITRDELTYIQRNASVADEKHQIIPWKSLLSSKPVYAIAASHTTDNWGFYTLLTQMPSFFTGE